MVKELEVLSTERQDAYRKFFLEKMKQWNVDTPADLSVEERKKFFNEVDDEWK